MPLTKKAIKEQLLADVYGRRKGSSFSPYHVPTPYDRQKKDEKKEKRKDKDKKKKEKPDVEVVARNSGNMNSFRPNGFYHGVTLEFALGDPDHYGNTPSPAYTEEERENWGTGFGNPLVNPKRDSMYIVRATIDQLRADPMIGGFKLLWQWPAGWRVMDGYPHVIFVEASSNPLYVQRAFLSPAGPITSGVVFRCRIRGWYP